MKCRSGGAKSLFVDKGIIIMLLQPASRIFLSNTMYGKPFAYETVPSYDNARECDASG